MSNLSELLIRSQKQQEKHNDYRQINSQTNLAGGRDLADYADVKKNTDQTTTDTTDIYTPTLALAQAEAWATKALEISMRAREERKKHRQDPEPTCEVAFAVALFNIAALRRVSRSLPFLSFLLGVFLIENSFYLLTLTERMI